MIALRYFFSVSWNYCTTLPSHARIDLETRHGIPSRLHGNVTTKSCLYNLSELMRGHIENWIAANGTDSDPI